jgi:K(+)-stimulated pyrophosphate-energized sodium pump
MDGVNTYGGFMFPLALVAAGIIASIIAIVVVGVINIQNPAHALTLAINLAGGLVLATSFFLSDRLFGNYSAFYAVALGIISGIAIGNLTERYTSDAYKSVRELAGHAKMGPAVTVLNGLAIGMISTVWPIIVIAVAVYASYFFLGLYGVVLSAVGMLSTVGIVVSVDTYGPISDNAGGIAQMSNLKPEVRAITDRLDSVGNTTAAIGKGFAIGSAALTALALFISYAQIAGINNIDLLTTPVVIGMFIGSMMPFLFSALTIQSVGRAAAKMIEEVRHQFKEKPGIMEGSEKPDYAKCVDISTQAALREMVAPSLLVIFTPLAVGLIVGVEALGGLLGGALVTGVVLAITMSNAGGAWDNAKKYIETGEHGGKGSPAHQSAVIGDTIGDPMKDTAGPSINTLIKLMAVVSLVFLPVLMR